MSRHSYEALQTASGVMRMIADSHASAMTRAYHERRPIRGVVLDQATHDAAAEATQMWSEHWADEAPPGCDQQAPQRVDGRPPALSRVFGLDVTVGDVDGVFWDLGPDSAPFDLSWPKEGVS